MTKDLNTIYADVKTWETPVPHSKNISDFRLTWFSYFKLEF